MYTPDPTASAHFYRDLPALPSLEAALDTAAQADVPDDWHYVVADVVQSTQAIAAGAYKQVNTVGVACIAALANMDRSLQLPFVFGGDGATFAVPDSHIEPTLRALRGTQQLAAQQFGLQLRAGLVPVGELRAAGHGVKVAKVQLSTHVGQAVLAGSGWAEAERRVKAGWPDAGVLHVQPDDGPAEASFEGFECRWQEVPSFQGHKLALIVLARASDPAQAQHAYQRVLAQLRAVLGDDLSAHHPLRAERMRLSFSPRQLMGEWMVRTAGLRFTGKLAYAARLLLHNVAGSYLFARRIDTASVAWSHYRDDLVRQTDFRKFDAALRMVLDVTDAQYQALQAWLDAQQAQGALVYGLHLSDHALVTCLVESHADKHLHFVDGSDGGYALAARQLKRHLLLIQPQAQNQRP